LIKFAQVYEPYLVRTSQLFVDIAFSYKTKIARSCSLRSHTLKELVFDFFGLCPKKSKTFPRFGERSEQKEFYKKTLVIDITPEFYNKKK
jgi:hypothetical protein